VNAIVAEATRGCRTDEEKAMALWSWVLYKRFQLSPHDPSAIHPVRAMNGYGYGICGHTSAWMKCLLKAAGIQARVQELWGHTVSEAFWDGAWHMLDGNVKVFYLAADNRGIASLAELERNEALILRGIHSRDPWVRRPEPKWRTDEFVRYMSYKDNYEEDAYDAGIARDYSMAMTLRPGEKLVRWWEPRLNKSERRDGRTPQRYANGQLVWEPDLKRINVRPYLSVPKWGNIATTAEDGRAPAVHVAELQGKLYTRPAVFTIPVASPYPIIGARFHGSIVKQGGTKLDLVSVFYGRPGWRPGDLFQSRSDTRGMEIDLDLDPYVKKTGVLYDYGVGFAIAGNSEAAPPTESGLDAFRVETDLQVSPHSLPALALGKNVVRFRQAAAGKVRITHRWREIHDRRPPSRVEAPLGPRQGEEVRSLAPLLKWSAATDPDASDKIADYQVMVSLRPDCRWPLSPTLHQSMDSDAAQWQLPSGFLNPGTTYYWKVRARDSRGDIGEWSAPFSFKTGADAR
jgi:hypothetical protein